MIIFSFLATAVAIYSLAVIFRIILTWFSGMDYGKVAQFLNRITDPYLNWWRNNLNLRFGALDLSPIAGLTALSIAQTIFATIAQHGRISLGIILSVTLQAVWSAASFIIFLCLVIIILRFIAYITNRNIYSRFWRFIDTVSQPLLYRLNRLIFGGRIVNYVNGIIASAAVLTAILVIGRFAVRLLARFLLGLPL